MAEHLIIIEDYQVLQTHNYSLSVCLAL